MISAATFFWEWSVADDIRRYIFWERSVADDIRRCIMRK